MKLKSYELLLEMNRGFDQVTRSLKALAKYAALQPDEVRRFEKLASEARSATNTHLLDALSAVESAQAAHLFKKRTQREFKEDHA